jgi:cytoskeletal protein RodZ
VVVTVVVVVVVVFIGIVVAIADRSIVGQRSTLSTGAVPSKQVSTNQAASSSASDRCTHALSQKTHESAATQSRHEATEEHNDVIFVFDRAVVGGVVVRGGGDVALCSAQGD